MPFKITRKKWVEVEADRVEGIITGIKYWGWAWTPESLKEELGSLGLGYSEREVLTLNDELHRRGIVEDVGG